MRSSLLIVAALSCLAFTGCVGEVPLDDEPVEGATAASSVAPLDWFPGHYVLLLQPSPTSGSGERGERDRVLGDAGLVTPFRGLQIKYDWSTFETTEGDYSTGLAGLKSDLDALAAVPASRGGPKKLVIMLQYKQFDAGEHAVPSYLRKAGSAYCAGNVCGEYQMSNGATAMVWQPAVRLRFEAWARAVGSYVATHYPHQVAAVVLPETANSEGNVPLSSVGYTHDTYFTGLTDIIASLTAPDSFPKTPVIEYINFFPPNGNDATTYLTRIAEFAAAHPHAGLGCPDVGSVASFHPPGYDVLGSATFQGVVPFNVAVETPDYETDRNATLAGAYGRAINGSSHGGFGAQMVAWSDLETKGGRAFDLQDVSDYIRTHPMPNTAPPSSH
jgi:hypothetical protein